MTHLTFTWDATKAKANLKKHGVSFPEAQSVFLDEHARLLDDPDHSAHEKRFVLLGLSVSLPDVGRRACLPRSSGDDSDHLSPKGHGRRTDRVWSRRTVMRKEYDFNNARANPYANRLKRAVTIRLDEPTIDYFKALASETGVGYQTLINSYLRDCAASKRRPNVRWTRSKGAA